MPVGFLARTARSFRTAPSSGYNPSPTLVLSQVFLSFGIPFALVPLVAFCRNPTLMGTLVNRRLTRWAAYAVASTIIILNVFLLYDTLL